MAEAGLRRFQRDVDRGRSAPNRPTARTAARAGAREVILKIGVRHAAQDALQDLRARDLSRRDGDGAGPDRLCRRPAGAAAGDPAVLLPGRQGGCAGDGRDRRDRRSTCRAFAGGAATSERAGRASREPRARVDGRYGARAADRARPWPQRRQGRHRQYRRHRAPAGIRAGAARRADGGGGRATISPISSRARSSASTGRASTASTSCCISALGGGGVASLRHDPQGKALAQMLMDFPVAVPADWLERGRPARRLDARAQAVNMARRAEPPSPSPSHPFRQGADRQPRRNRLPRRCARCARSASASVAIHHARRGAGARMCAWPTRPSRSPARRRSPPISTAAQIIEAALATGADAIHPGYGFLSENAGFARRPSRRPASPSSGPTPRRSRLMGDKISARDFARRMACRSRPR